MTVTRSGIEDQRQRDRLHAQQRKRDEQAHRYLLVPMHRALLSRLNVAIIAAVANLIALLLVSMR